MAKLSNLASKMQYGNENLLEMFISIISLQIKICVSFLREELRLRTYDAIDLLILLKIFQTILQDSTLFRLCI